MKYLGINLRRENTIIVTRFPETLKILISEIVFWAKPILQIEQREVERWLKYIYFEEVEFSKHKSLATNYINDLLAKSRAHLRGTQGCERKGKALEGISK